MSTHDAHAAEDPDRPFTDAGVEMAHLDPAQPKARWRWTHWLIVGLAIAGLAVCVASFSGGGSGSSEQIRARVAYEQAVKDRLVAPSTARLRHLGTQPDGSAWIVLGQVDAQNAFGATLRQNYACRVAGTTVTSVEIG